MMPIITGFIITCILTLIPQLYSSTEIAWDVFAICSALEKAVWLFLVFYYIPYKQLFAKSIVIVLFLHELFDPIAYITWPLFKNVYYAYIIKFILSAAILCHTWWKNYERENDILDDHHFFRIGIRPKGLQDFLLSLIQDPIGGIGIYVRGKYYHYRHGKLVVNDIKYLERSKKLYRIKRMRRIDEKRLSLLKSLLQSKYSQWSWLWGCKTVLEPIMGKRGKPYFMRKDL